MVAPKARTIWTTEDPRPRGITLFCPECRWGILRCETPDDHAPGACPEEVANAGPLGFVARCDLCGFRVLLRGDRLPTVAMTQADP